MKEEKRRRKKVAVNEKQSLPEHASPADMAAAYGGGGHAAVALRSPPTQAPVEDAPKLRVADKPRPSPRASKPRASSAPSVTTNADTTKNFSSLSSTVVRALRGFPDAWKQSRYKGQKRPSTRWVIETVLLNFLEGEDAELVSRVGEAWVAKFESDTDAEVSREDFSVRTSIRVAERLEQVSKLWNDDSVTPARPYLSYSWFFEAAYVAFVAGGELVDQVSTAWLESVRKTFEAGPSKN